MWKDPFLKGNRVSLEFRVPSGKSNSLQLLSLMAVDSFCSALMESALRDLLMNSVPQSHAPMPKNGRYNISLFETTVARPIIGHRYASTKETQMEKTHLHNYNKSIN